MYGLDSLFTGFDGSNNSTGFALDAAPENITTSPSSFSIEGTT